MKKEYFVYIMTNKYKTVTYIGITSDVIGRVWEHKHKIYPDSFSAKNNTNMLIYFEDYDNPNDAIAREKQLKSWRKDKKIKLINTLNPNWEDLYKSFFD